MKSIVLAGGCFWGVQAYYQKLRGIMNTKVGYAQGYTTNPNYAEVKKSSTGHAEVCFVEYDEKIISLDQILEHLFRIINPTLLNRQGNDIGTQYRTGIYYSDDADITTIKNFIIDQQQKNSQKIQVEVEKLIHFYDAEDYHQNYLLNNPFGYCHVDLSLIKDEEKD